jgi:hypothetical protein
MFSQWADRFHLKLQLASLIAFATFLIKTGEPSFSVFLIQCTNTFVTGLRWWGRFFTIITKQLIDTAKQKNVLKKGKRKDVPVRGNKNYPKLEFSIFFLQ